MYRESFLERLSSVIASYVRCITQLTDVFTLIDFALAEKQENAWRQGWISAPALIRSFDSFAYTPRTRCLRHEC